MGTEPAPPPQKHYPGILRAVGIALLIVGALLKIEHLPGAGVVFIAAWVVTLASIVWRVVVREAIVPKEAARDLFTLGVVSIIILCMLHLPGGGIALAVMVIGALGLLWYERERILPGRGDKASKPFLFYSSSVLIVVGAVFRIELWPYGTALLVGGLALAAVWFISSMGADREG